MSGLILIIEDDANIASLVATYLEREGFTTLIAADGRSGLEWARQRKPALIILDLMLPKLDGLTICRELRQESEVPILILSAKGEEVDRLLGFSLAADDYVVKPFSPRELVERAKAILRRVGTREGDARQPLRRGDLVLDLERYKATVDGRAIPLTATEFRLLEILMTAPGRVFTREELLARSHSHSHGVVDRVIDVHIGNLRQKLGDDPAHPRFIVTVRGVGYSFAETTEA